MKKLFKSIFTIIVLIFIGYVIYRNIILGTIPSIDLIKDEKTMSMYNNIMPNTSNNIWKNLYFTEDSLSVKNIPVEMKYNIAFKNMGTGESTISEDRIKKAYEKLFGEKSYLNVSSFQGGCNTYKYINTRKTYEKNQNTKCEPGKISILSKIIDAKQKDNSMDITVIIAYIDKEKRKVYKSCNNDMSKCSNVIKSNVDNFDEADLEKFKKKLNRYVFTYNLSKEEYYFDSVRKSK